MILDSVSIMLDVLLVLGCSCISCLLFLILLFQCVCLQLCSALIAQLTKQFLSDHSATEAISARLRQHCPSLYSADDSVVTQAAESLAVAKTKTNPAERQSLLDKSLLVCSAKRFVVYNFLILSFASC